MSFLRENIWPTIKPSFKRLVSFNFCLGRPIPCQEQASLLHFVAARHQKQYVQEQMDHFQQLGLQRNSQKTPASDTVQDLSLLFSACDYVPSTQIVSMLLDAGFSTQIRLRLRKPSIMSATARLPNLSASGWPGWDVSLNLCPRSVYVHEQGMRAEFSTMEVLLRSHSQEDLVIVHRYRNGTLVPVSLRDIVRQFRPPNMRPLLELPPSDNEDPSPWPHLQKLMENLHRISMMKRFMKTIIERKSTLSPFGAPVAIVSKTEMFDITEGLYVRVW